MNYIGLIFYQSLLFVFLCSGQCQESEYDLDLDSVRIENTGHEWIFVQLSKFVNVNKFIFSNAELNEMCGGAFPSSSVEIMEVFDKTVKFSLRGWSNEKLFFIKLSFSAKSSVQQFFQNIRSQQREFGSELQMKKLFRLKVPDAEHFEVDLQLLARPATLYLKDMSPDRLADTRSFTFVRFDPQTGSSEVFLVLTSFTFNISERFGTNKFFLCSPKFPEHKFVVMFHNHVSAKNFITFIEDDLDDAIPCPKEYGWATYRFLRILNSR